LASGLNHLFATMRYDPQALMLVVVNLLVALWVAVEVLRVLAHSDTTTLSDLRIKSKGSPAESPVLPWQATDVAKVPPRLLSTSSG
jgi:hypothetical protein